MNTRCFVRAGRRKALVDFLGIPGVLLVLAGQGFGQSSQTIPPNASPSLYGSWTCNDGYIKRGRTCVGVANATDSEVRKLMIARSLAGYSGNCPCPYNTDRAGRSCGRRSAYSRPGGASPLCYDNDISAASVKLFRARYPSRQ